ncbi:MAG: hypothetical protein HY332_23165 [Chloroflexi bacterium]|nr:hypothetical protein [Chloroflexota bacterium]
MERSTSAPRPSATAPAAPAIDGQADLLDRARRRHEVEEAELRALYDDTDFIEGVRTAVTDAERHGTTHWPTLDDVRRTYDLHDEA